jgi:hypothetical protein
MVDSIQKKKECSLGRKQSSIGCGETALEKYQTKKKRGGCLGRKQSSIGCGETTPKKHDRTIRKNRKVVSGGNRVPLGVVRQPFFKKI